MEFTVVLLPFERQGVDLEPLYSQWNTRIHGSNFWSGSAPISPHDGQFLPVTNSQTHFSWGWKPQLNEMVREGMVSHPKTFSS